MITILSLFSGIGLFDLGVLAALEERGYAAQIAAQVEIDPFCRKVLERHYPSTSREVIDVREVDETNTPWCDLVVGGFPCTDVSAAGPQEGLSGARSGLWWEQWRIVRDFRPTAGLVENVGSGLSHWHGTVRCSLERLGYRTASARIDAADVGAPHGRARVFVLAYADSKRKSQPKTFVDQERRRPIDGCSTLANSDGQRLAGAWRECEPSGGAAAVNGREERRGSTQSGVGRDAYGRAARLDAHRWPLGQGEALGEDEPPRTVVGRIPNRIHRIRALGNAITPQQGLAAMRWALNVMGW